MWRRAVFLDKDGTLLEDVPQRAEPRPLRFLPGAGEGLRVLHAAGFRLVLVTQQSGIARGLFSEEALRESARRLRQALEGMGVPLLGYYYCPHAPPSDCPCLKPRPGMILRACREHALSPEGSWMVGDILDDVEAGRRAGLRTVLIDNGGETEWTLSPDRLPHHSAADLAEAARLIAGRRPAAAPPNGKGWEP